MPERYVGRTIGRFRIDAPVGSGGFAWVYRGYDPQLEITVAIKILKPQYAGDETFESRFRREASIAARLRHPNIIRILEVGQDGDAVYFAMDFLPHGLVERLRIMETLPESMIVRLGMDVASALAFAHREGVIHRDIKADNVLFDEHGNAVVADFGIARAVTSIVDQTGTNMVVGTPQYFSPEQARGLALDGRSDVYSLGVTLYRAATGRVPFEGQDWYEIARQHVEEEPPPPRDLNADISPALEGIILRCMEKSPDDRYESAEALHESLTALAPGNTSPDMTRTVEVPKWSGNGGARPRTSRPTPLRSTPVRGSAARIASGPRGVPTLGRGRAPWVAGVVALLALGAALAVARSRGDSPLEIARANPAPDSLRRPDAGTSAVVARDSLGRVVASGRPPGSDSAPSRGTLQVDAPANATLSLNGRTIGRGYWISDTLVAGTYTLSASVQTLPGCPTMRDTRQVRVAPGRPARLGLAPRACGYLSIAGRPPGAAYEITSHADSARTNGSLADGLTAVMLPVGSYRLRVTSPGCTPYEADVEIQPSTWTTQRLVLLCGA